MRDKTRPGVIVCAPDGRELAYIPIGNPGDENRELPTNVGFGRGVDADLLYVTSGKRLYSIRLGKDGHQLPPP